MTQSNSSTPGTKDAASVIAAFFGAAPAEAPANAAPAKAGDKPTNPASEEKDLLGRSRTQYAEWDGKTPLAQHPRFQELHGKVKDLEKVRSQLEGELAAAKAGKSPFETYYSKYSDPEKVFKDDMMMLEQMEAMRNDPAVRQAIQVLRQNRPTTNEEKQTMTTQTNDQKPANDPRIDALYQERTLTRALGILADSPILPKNHKLLTNFISSRHDHSQELTADKVLEYLEGFKAETGWTNEDLVGTNNAPKASTTPPPAPSAGIGTGAPASAPEPAKESQDGKPLKDVTDMRAFLKDEFAAAFQRAEAASNSGQD